MYYSVIGLIAILILFIVNWDILYDSCIYDRPAWNVYRRFLFAVMIYYIVDILWGILESKKFAASLFADTTIYFIATAVGLSFWAEYTVAYLEEKHRFGKVLIIFGRVLAGVIFALAIVNIFTPVLFTVDKECVYTPLPSRYLIISCQIVFLLAISVCAYVAMFRMIASAKKKSDIKSETKVRYRILAAFGIIMAVCLFIQLWFPYLPVYSIAYMLGTCMLHSFLINDEKEEFRLGMEEAEKVAELKDRFFAVLNNMPGMTFTKDAETGKYLTCNQAFAEYAHKENPDGVVGLTDRDIFDAETAEHFIKDDKIALKLSKPYVFYEDVLDAVGNLRQLQTTKIKYKDTEGRACVLGMCQDITDLIRVEHENAMTKEAYESAVATGLMYTRIAQTLARDYMDMYYVNTDSEEFTEYRKGEEVNVLTEVRSGWHFFSDCKQELSESVYSEDKEEFLQAMNRKNLMKALEQNDTFIKTFRRMINDRPTYFSMKVSRMVNDEQHIIIGFVDVDFQMLETMATNERNSNI